MTSWTSLDLSTCRMYPEQGAEDSTDIAYHQHPPIQVRTHTLTLPPSLQLPPWTHNSTTHGMPRCFEHLFHPTSAMLICSSSLSAVSGRKSPQTECGGEGAAAAKPESRGVERGGRQRRHLQRVPLQGLQPGISISGTEFYNMGDLVCRVGSPICKAQPKKPLRVSPEMQWLSKITCLRHQSARSHPADGLSGKSSPKRGKPIENPNKDTEHLRPCIWLGYLETCGVKLIAMR